jgi:hypothetical protein
MSAQKQLQDAVMRFVGEVQRLTVVMIVEQMAATFATTPSVPEAEPRRRGRRLARGRGGKLKNRLAYIKTKVRKGTATDIERAWLQKQTGGAK